MAAVPKSQVAHPDAPEPEEENQVTRPSDLGFATREIEVEPVNEPPPKADNQGMYVITIAETIEEFTYGASMRPVRLERGRRYRVPYHIAQYLDGLGYVYHR